MIIIFQALLTLINIAFGVFNHRCKQYIAASFNFFVAGMCFIGAIAALSNFYMAT